MHTVTPGGKVTNRLNWDISALICNATEDEASAILEIIAAAVYASPHIEVSADFAMSPRATK